LWRDSLLEVSFLDAWLGAVSRTLRGHASSIGGGEFRIGLDRLLLGLPICHFVALDVGMSLDPFEGGEGRFLTLRILWDHDADLFGFLSFLFYYIRICTTSRV